MTPTHAKWNKALAIIVATLQIPLLMLWKITYDTVDMESRALKLLGDGGFTLAFDPELLAAALLHHLPLILSLVVCLVLSVLGLILILKRKGSMGVVMVFIYAVTLVACGYLLYAFSHPYIMGDDVNRLYLSEYMFYRYFMGMELRIDRVFPLLQSIKYMLLGLHAAGSATLCVLGILQTVRRRKDPPQTPPKAMEDTLFTIEPLSKHE